MLPWALLGEASTPDGGHMTLTRRGREFMRAVADERFAAIGRDLEVELQPIAAPPVDERLVGARGAAEGVRADRLPAAGDAGRDGRGAAGFSESDADAGAQGAARVCGASELLAEPQGEDRRGRAGAEPAAITNCLNFGNPYNTEVYYQFVYAIKGMGEACKKFDTPVTGGNVSFYNQSSDNDAVFPTPTIGMVGLIEGNKPHMTMDFKNAGDVIYLLGNSKNDIASSHYLAHYHKVQYSPAPYFNLDEEHQLHKALLGLINGNHIVSAHDCSEGGLFITLLESAFHRNLSFNIQHSTSNIRLDSFLFGEAQGRVVISVKAHNCAQVESFLSGLNMPFEKLGTVTENEIQVNGVNFGKTADFANIYNNSLAEKLA
jgi:selenophosphate synthetase-related protein